MKDFSESAYIKNQVLKSLLHRFQLALNFQHLGKGFLNVN